MKERPILFSAPMVRALLAGTKSVTRRIVKWKPREAGLNLAFSGFEVGLYNTANPRSGWVLRSRDGGGCWNDRTYALHCPYGAPGDRLWVREAFTHITGNGIRVHFRADGEPTDSAGNVLPTEPGLRRWSPSIHLPRKLARITLDVVSTRIERLHAVTEDEATREGVAAATIDATARDRFAELWKAINGAESWDANPHVWRVEFKPVELAR